MAQPGRGSLMGVVMVLSLGGCTVRTGSSDTFDGVANAGQRTFFVGSVPSTGQGVLQSLARIEPW